MLKWILGEKMVHRNITMSFALLLTCACLVDLPSLEDTSFKCTEDEHCAEGYLCDELNLDNEDRGTCLVVVDNPQCDANVCPDDQCINDPDMGENGQHRCVERRHQGGGNYGSECDDENPCSNARACVDGHCASLQSCGTAEDQGCGGDGVCVAFSGGNYCVPKGGCSQDNIADQCDGEWGESHFSGNGVCVLQHSGNGDGLEVAACGACPPGDECNCGVTTAEDIFGYQDATCCADGNKSDGCCNMHALGQDPDCSHDGHGDDDDDDSGDDDDDDDDDQGVQSCGKASDCEGVNLLICLDGVCVALDSCESGDDCYEEPCVKHDPAENFVCVPQGQLDGGGTCEGSESNIGSQCLGSWNGTVSDGGICVPVQFSNGQSEHACAPCPDCSPSRTCGVSTDNDMQFANATCCADGAVEDDCCNPSEMGADPDCDHESNNGGGDNGSCQPVGDNGDECTSSDCCDEENGFVCVKATDNGSTGRCEKVCAQEDLGQYCAYANHSTGSGFCKTLQRHGGGQETNVCVECEGSDCEGNSCQINNQGFNYDEAIACGG